MMRKYKGIDIGRILFACLIPFLHIEFKENDIVDIIRQYFSRLGVPFFFAISGMFLFRSIGKYGYWDAWKKYTKRVGRILLIWIVIYSPFIIHLNLQSIQMLLFKTPAFLWYLTAILVASIPFCLIRNRKVLYIVAFFLYVFGTLFGSTYKWLTGGGTRV